MKKKIIGIIAEYNPFHNGHKYHIEKAKELTQADYVVVIMSGNFLQRGEPAIIDKYSRSEMALNNGADLVIELPVCFSCASAEYFARGAVSLLKQMGCIDFLCFGCETPDTQALEYIASTLLDEPENYCTLLKKYLSAGFTFPKARALALSDFFKESNININESILESPNNILAIEYIKALKYFNCNIKPLSIARTDSGYHSIDISSVFSSATAIRHNIQNLSFDISHAIPTSTDNILEKNYNKSYPIWTNDFTTLLTYRLFSNSTYTDYFDITNELSNSISKNIYCFDSFENLISLLKSKNYTHTKISRCLIHLLLNIKKEDIDLFVSHNYAQYLRILGFKKGSDLLKIIKVNSSIPLISKIADANNLLDDIGLCMLNYDIFASDIYNLIVKNKFNTTIKNDYTHSLIIK